MITKICQCKTCAQINPQQLSNFYKNKNMKDGLDRYCIDCARKYRRNYYKNNAKKVIDSAIKYYNKNSEIIKIKKKAFRELNPDKIRVNSRLPANRFKAAQNAAKKRNIIWELTLDEWTFFIKDNKCHYCNEGLPTQGYALDRMDSNIGYIKTNVVPCCTACNRIKGNNLTYIEMIEVSKLLKMLRNK